MDVHFLRIGKGLDTTATAGCAALAVDFQHALKGFTVENEALCAPEKLAKHDFR